MKITIIGCGNSGCAHAFKLSENGHSVTLLKTSHAMHDENFDIIQKNGGIWGIDHTNNNKKSFQNIILANRNVKEALNDSEVIMIMTQSINHESIAKLIAPFIPKTLKLLVVIPGNLGSLYFRQYIFDESVIIAEGESTPYDARIIEPGTVTILFKNVRNALGFLPQNQSSQGLAIASNLFDTYRYLRSNVIESALHNPNLVVHTVGTIMSASRIEYSKGEFWMYKEAFSPSIWNLITKLDEEKNTVIKKYSGVPASYLDVAKWRNEEDLTKDSLDVFKSYGEDGGPKGPTTIYSRYLLEDVANGLVLLSSFGSLAGVQTPVTNALIEIASSLVNIDFRRIGRTPEKFNIKSMQQLVSIL